MLISTTKPSFRDKKKTMAACDTNSNHSDSSKYDDTLDIMTAASRNPSRNVSRHVSRCPSLEENDTLGIMTAASLASRNVSRQVSRRPSLDENDTLAIMTAASRNVSRQVSRCPSLENSPKPIRDALQDALDASIVTATVFPHLTASRRNTPSLNSHENTAATTPVFGSSSSPRHLQESAEPRPWMSVNRTSPTYPPPTNPMISPHPKRQIIVDDDDYGNPDDDDYMMEEFEESHFKGDDLLPTSSLSPGIFLHRYDTLSCNPCHPSSCCYLFSHPSLFVVSPLFVL